MSASCSQAASHRLSKGSIGVFAQRKDARLIGDLADNFQRLHPEGTLGVSVGEMLTGATDKYFRGKKLGQCLSANTSAYS
jgi:hypothetical protein